MVKPWRKRLLRTLIVVFVGLGTGVVFYAQGWRLDFETLTIKKIGAIYVRSFPEGAAITLNGKPVKRGNGLFDKGTLINHLFPRTYTLELTLSGYRPWKKKVVIAPSAVSELKHAVLVPASPEKAVNEPVKNFWIVSGELILKTASGTLVARDIPLPGTAAVSGTGDGLILTKGTGRVYFVNDLANGTSRRLTSPGNTSLNTGDGDLVVTTPTTLSLLDPVNGSTTLVERRAGLEESSVAISPSWIAWTTFDKRSSASTLSLYRKSSRERTNVAVSLPGTTVRARWSANEMLGVVEDDGGFFIYEPSVGTLKKIASDVRDIAWSADGALVAALESRSIEIFSLSDDRYWRFNLPDVRAMERLTWYRDGEHLFLHYPDRVLFLDLEDAGLENLVEVARTEHGEYDAGTNRFYFLEESGRLSRLQFPE